MAIVDTPWDGSASRFPTTDDYCKSCLIDNNPPGQDKVQALCKLPIKEPSGNINSNGVHAAAASLAGARNALKGVSPADKKKAARALSRIYGQMKEDLPQSIKQML